MKRRRWPMPSLPREAKPATWRPRRARQVSTLTGETLARAERHLAGLPPRGPRGPEAAPAEAPGALWCGHPAEAAVGVTKSGEVLPPGQEAAAEAVICQACTAAEEAR